MDNQGTGGGGAGSAQATSAGGGAGAATATPCQLTRTPTDPVCPLKAAKGSKVTLTLKNTKGTVVFQKASYGGTTISGTPAAQISFTVADGSQELKIVFNFSDPAAGQADLCESCKDNTLLAVAHAADPAMELVICGQ